jgi:rSAM/selenodomain-associated transferase 1
MIDTLIVIAKQPIAGRVKTRLVPPLTHVQAAELATAALRDTLHAVAAAPAQRRLLAFDGCADEWLPTGWQHCAQPTGGLDRRLAAAFAASGAGPALLVGMDTPQLQAGHLAAFDPSTYDACLGPARDGGYWAIGFRDPAMAASTIIGVPMSSDRTADEQLRRLAARGLRVQLLDELTDVDTFHDARAVAAVARNTRFATALARIDVPLASVS